MIITIATKEDDFRAHVTVVGEITESVLNQITNAVFPIHSTLLPCVCGARGIPNVGDYMMLTCECGSTSTIDRWWMRNG